MSVEARKEECRHGAGGAEGRRKSKTYLYENREENTREEKGLEREKGMEN